MTKWSLAYELLRIVIRQFFKNFYNKIESFGVDNIPDNKPIIFAANHQNALMDPYAILFTSKQQTVFLTRADIFKNPILLKIFEFFKMLPVYRIRDGKESLKNNERIFNTSVEILEANMSLGLFPEATHTDKRHLRPLKKAVPRIAFQAEVKNNFELDLSIIPVGIYYEDYTHSNSKLFVNYGKPIKIAQFREDYEKNEQIGFNSFRTKLEEEIKSLIIHQPDMDNYDLYEGIRLYYRSKMLNTLKLSNNKLKNSFKADKETVSRLKLYFTDNQNSIDDLNNTFNSYNKISEENNINLTSTSPNSLFYIFIKSIFYLIAFPIFLFGLVNNYIYYKIIINFLKKVKDKQFHTSIKFALSLLINVFIYPIQAAIFWAISGNWQWALLYLFSLPLTAVFANRYRYSFTNYQRIIALWKFSKSTDYSNYLNVKTKLDSILSNIMKRTS